MVELVVRDASGRVARRVAANERLFRRYVRAAPRGAMATRWFLRLLGALFAPTGVAGSASFTFVDTGGTSRTQNTKLSAGTAAVFVNTAACANKLWIGYGTGTASPTRDDYKLQSKVGEAVAAVSADETWGTLTLSASFTVTGDITVYEVGLEWEGCVSSYNVCGRILLDRTVFPGGIAVKAGQTLTIVYRIAL